MDLYSMNLARQYAIKDKDKYLSNSKEIMGNLENELSQVTKHYNDKLEAFETLEKMHDGSLKEMNKMR